MTWRSLMTGLMAGVGFLACAASANAQETFRLKLTPGDNTPATTLRATTDDADVLDVHYRYGGYRGYYGGYRGYAGGYRGFVGVSFGYRGYGYRPYYAGYRSYYAPRYYGNVYYGGYPRYYSSPRIYYYTPSYYCPISETSLVTPTFSLRIVPSTTVETSPYQQVVPDATPRTYPYDGGPSVPVPMPKAVPEESSQPKVMPPVTPDRAVSLPASSGTKFAYPAYGDTPRKTDFAVDRGERKSEPLVRKP